jgi:hypothetical protein
MGLAIANRDCSAMPARRMNLFQARGGSKLYAAFSGMRVGGA